MKKNLFAIITAISIFTLLFATAFTSGASAPAPANVKGYGTLLAYRFIYGKGYVFVFQLSGPLKQQDLMGYVDISGSRFDLGCTLKDITTTIDEDGKIVEIPKRAMCTASIPPKFVGRKAFVFLVASGTYIKIPPRNTNHCYSVYTWNDNWDDWEAWASFCTDATRLRPGDYIRAYTPKWDATFTYVYQTSAPCADNYGRGFYFGVTFGNYYSILCPPK